MIIDFHTHVFAPSDDAAFTSSLFHQRVLAAGHSGRPQPHSMENVLKAQEIGGIDATVISNPLHVLRDLEREEQLDLVRRHNRYIASQTQKYDFIYGFASAVPFGGDPFLREFERAVKGDGLKGAWIQSSLQGHYPDDDDFAPFFSLACELDVPVVVHPPSVGFGEERMRDYRLASSIGRPMDGALAIARMIVRGVFENFPKLKLVGTHLGGGICEMIGRMNYAYSMGDEAFFLGAYAPLLINKPPIEYLRMMYLDSVSYHVPAARCALETIGADKFLFGTDAPPLTSLKRDGVDLIRQLRLDSEDEGKIFFGNAAKLLKLQ
jgi:aminocarboxymuconate-semialdehyde decarboxylase